MGVITLSFEPTNEAMHGFLNQLAEAVGHITIEVGRNAQGVPDAPQTMSVAQLKMQNVFAQTVLANTFGIVHSSDIGCGCPIRSR